MQGIYQIRNIENNKVYIGSSSDIELRWKTHKNELNKNKHHSYKLQNDWNKYSEENFVFELLEIDDEANREAISSLEQKYIDKYRPHENGYNVRSKVFSSPLKSEKLLSKKGNNMSKSFHIERSIIKIGNSQGIILPYEFLASMNLSKGDSVSVSYENGKITIRNEIEDNEDEEIIFKEKVLSIITEFLEDKNILKKTFM